MAKVEITNNRGIIVRKNGDGVYLNSGLLGKSAAEVDTVTLGIVLEDVRQDGSANNAGVAYIVAPAACTVERVRTVLAGGALTVTDAAISVAANDGAGGGYGSAITAVTITQAGSAAGDLDDSGAITTGNTVAEGGTIRFLSDGAAGGAAQRPVYIAVDLRYS